MIHITPPARSEWHHVPTGEIHWGTFTEAYGFEFRPGWAFRCGSCIEVGVGYDTPAEASRGAEVHRRKEHPTAVVVELEAPDRSTHLAEATPDEWLLFARG